MILKSVTSVLRKIFSELAKSKGVSVLMLFISFLLVPSILAGEKPQPRPDTKEQQEILGVVSETSPTPTITPTPVKKALTPTATLTPSPTPTPTASPTQRPSF